MNEFNHRKQTRAHVPDGSRNICEYLCLKSECDGYYWELHLSPRRVHGNQTLVGKKTKRLVLQGQRGRESQKSQKVQSDIIIIVVCKNNVYDAFFF